MLNRHQQLAIELLKEEVKPAMGCTEPVAVALAAAKTAEILRDTLGVVSIDETQLMLSVKVNPNLFKNGLSVGIPNCSERGIHVAATLGFFACESSLGLNVFAQMTQEKVQQAIKFATSGKVALDILETTDKVRVEIEGVYGVNKIKVILSGKHDRFESICINDDLIWENNEILTCGCVDKTEFFELKISEIIQLVEGLNENDLAFLEEGLIMNKAVAKAGLESPMGMGVGFYTQDAVRKGLLGDDVVNRAMSLTAGASDARMSGLNLPVMSSNGSGNNGLTAILPLVAWFEKNETSTVEQLRAVALSHLFNCYIKDRIGRLSAMCSCSVAAATGSGAAIAWLLTHQVNVVEKTIKNMAGNLTGMICDGGKEGCALKLGTGAAAGVRAALLASNGVVVPTGNGIVDESCEKTIENMGKISQLGMQITDVTILNVMLDRVKLV